MYTLRTVFPNGEEHNQSLGDFYTLVDSVLSKEIFDTLSEQDKVNKAYVFALLSSEKSGKIWLNKPNTYYVMTESGRTFCKMQ